MPILSGLYGLTISSARGIIFFSPPVLVTVPALAILWCRRPAEASLFAAFIAVFCLGYSTYSIRDGGVCWGPRFLMPAIPFAVLPVGELLSRRGVAAASIAALAFTGLIVQIGGTLVDFQRVAMSGFEVTWVSRGAGILLPFGKSQIMNHWRALLAGKYLDWMPVRLYLVHGLAAALAYAAPPTAMTLWAARNLDRATRTARPSQR